MQTKNFLDNNKYQLRDGCVDLLLVNPSLNWKFDLEKKRATRIEESIPNQETPHIGMAYLLAVAKRHGLKVKYIDMIMDTFSPEQLMNYIVQANPAVIGLTSFTVQVRTAGALATKIKETFPNVTICAGGPHVTAIPQRSLKEFPAFDFVVCGEIEQNLVEIMNSYKDEKMLSMVPGVVTRSSNGVCIRPIEDLDSLPFPAWEEFDLKKYPGTYPHRTKLELPMVSGRGCPYLCTFCCRSLGNKIRHRSVSSVISEIEHNVDAFNCTSIAFLDETFLIDLRWINEFLDVFQAKGLHHKVTWSCSTRVNNVSVELLKRMKESGCYYIFYGMESADNQTLRLIKKNITVEQVRKAVQWTKEAGILPVGAFIIGLPGDTEEHAQKNIELAEELDLYSVTFPIAVPFPGTELRDMALKGEYGMRIIADNWNDYGKQEPGVMESHDLPYSRRIALQKEAYLRNPKKKIDKYLLKLNK